MSSETSVLYDERLHVPLRWWVQATMFLASIWLAFVVALPPVVAWAATGVLTVIVVALFLGYGAARVRVEGGVLHAGRARIPVSMLADPLPLDKEQTRLLAGREANAHAYFLLRPYLKRSVRVEVVDPADPAPYWLVSTRRPDELAAALESAGLQ
ncbi:MAG TPA: DUF3093 domain-containing protein [Nocardioidaceae bacterium]|nr:DUF3093 domain-containing protein [Nocardioidaceae bacterium]